MVVGLDAGAVGSGVFPFVDQDRDSTGPRLERVDHLLQRRAPIEPRTEYLVYVVEAVSTEPGRRHPETVGVVGTQHSHSGHGIVDATGGTAPMDLYDRVEQSRERQISRRGGNDVVGRPVVDSAGLRPRLLCGGICDCRICDCRVHG
ncbi:hypothetical protein [Nocardia cyriacigeorgica]|uniref:hypothetical protein n=1 Tax=Nocardia cyriacigeorgica TaxID=135487 RepID=UPI001E2CD0F7|nr:hypothetical protein [Nocardia cyriacigeorgica]